MPPVVVPSLQLPKPRLKFDFGFFSLDGISIKLRILISFFQILTQLGVVYSIPWPDMYLDLLANLQFFNVDLFRLAPIDCVFPATNFYHSLCFQTLLLPILSVVPLMLLLCRKAGGRGKRTKTGNAAGGEGEGEGGRKVLTLDWMIEQCQSAGFWILFVIYPSVSSKIFAVFQCIKVDDGSEWLRADLSLSCLDASYTVMSVYAGFMVLVYPLGTPLLYYYLLQKNRVKIDKLRTNQELRAKIVQGSRATVRFEQAEVAKQEEAKARAERMAGMRKVGSRMSLRSRRSSAAVLRKQSSKAWAISPAQFEELRAEDQVRVATPSLPSPVLLPCVACLLCAAPLRRPRRVRLQLC